MNPVTLAGPAVEPVTLLAMKAYLRLDGNDEDELVDALIMAGRLTVERATRLALVAQTLRWTVRAWPAGAALLVPCGPVISLEAVRILRAGETSDILAPELCRLDLSEDPARLLLDDTLPGPGPAPSGLEIDVVCGFGNGVASVPGPLVLAVERLVAFWFERRGDDERSPGPGGLPADVAALLAPFVRPRLS